jgi:hypothetical protein
MNTIKLELLPEFLDKLKELTEKNLYTWNGYKIISNQQQPESKFIKVEFQYDDLSILITHLLIINQY